MKNRDNQIVDKKLRVFLQKELPVEPKNHWFKSKVLNRLPPRRNPSALLEKWIILLSVVGALIAVIFQANKMYNSQAIYIRDLVFMAIYLLIFLGIAAWIVVPLARE